jgi:hypothetical protein
MDLGWCKEATNRVLVRSRTKGKNQKGFKNQNELLRHPKEQGVR